MRLWFCVAAILAACVIAGCGASGSSSSSAEAASAPGATPLVSLPRQGWIAANPGETGQSGQHASYEDLAASGEVIVGITFAEPEGAQLIRLNPRNGRPIWKARLPSYAEENAISIVDGRILVVAPGEKLSPDGYEGEGPAMAFAFTVDGAKIWEDSLAVQINGTLQSSWAPPQLPGNGETVPYLITDMSAIPGEIITYEGSLLRGINDRTGQEWTYSPSLMPEAILGPDPGGPADLHLISGTNQVLVDGRNGKEVKREIGQGKGLPLGLVGPLFQQQVTEVESPVKVPGVGPLWPVKVDAGGSIVFGTDEHALVAMNSKSGRKLWEMPMEPSYGLEAAAAGDGFMLINTAEGTTLLRE